MGAGADRRGRPREPVLTAAPPPSGSRGGHRFFATCARGTEGALRREIAGLRIAGARGDIGGVWFEGPLEMGFAVCLHARVAMRVLLEVGRFEADDGDSLYTGARAVDWGSWLNARTTLAVSADVSDTPGLRHSGFAALKVKDAVVDALRDALGARPDVDTRHPDLSIRLHMHGIAARLFLDLAGEPLHRRGYRVAMTDAPLKETLAAAVLALGRVDDDLPFVDPMCGSGTLAIEHALAARRIAPGLHRRFGFQRWPLFAADAVKRAWDRQVAAARAEVLPTAPAPIVCAERFPDAVEAARKNAEAAGVSHDLTFAVGDVRQAAPQWPRGNLVMNPPYGERLMGDATGAAVANSRGAQRSPPRSADPPRHPRGGGPDRTHGRGDGGVGGGVGVGGRGGGGAPSIAGAGPLPRDAHVQQLKLAGLYRGMAEALDRFAGWGVVVLSGNPMWTQEMRRRPAISHRLFNGPLEVRLLRYEIPARPPARDEPPVG